MPRVAFSEENKVATTNYDYPKLKLKNQERARIVLLEDPAMEFVHTLRAPKIVDGVPQMATTKKNGQDVTENIMDFIARPLCLGDFATLSDKGSDPKRCPMCKMAQEHPDMAQPPQIRYAMHVIRYRTKGGSHDPITPFSVETVVWSFTVRTFNKIVEFKTEWGDLRKHDLLLGPCENENFQKFDISVGAKAAWLEDEERRTLTKETFKNNQIPDLSIACGSKKELRWIEEDISKVLSAWAVVNGKNNVDPDDSASLDDDLNSLVGGGEDKLRAQEEWAPSADASPDSDLDDLLGSSSDEPEEPAKEKKVEEPKKEKSDDVNGFDDLLADL